MSHRLMHSPSFRSRFISWVLKRKMKTMTLPEGDQPDLSDFRSTVDTPVKAQTLEKGVNVSSVNEHSVKGEWQSPTNAPSDRCILYCHGGGYSFCSPATHRPMTVALAKKSGYKVFSLDYRLSPEHRFPAPVEDAVNAYQWLVSQGISAENIVLAGDSAGGGLCLALLLKLKLLGQPLPAGAILLSPWTDLAVTGDSIESNEASCAMFVAEGIRNGARLYLGDAKPTDPLASPLYGDLSGLPPLWVVASDTEILRDDALRLVDKAREQNVTTTLAVWHKQPHVWPTFYPTLPEAKLCVKQMAAFAQQQLT